MKLQDPTLFWDPVSKYFVSGCFKGIKFSSTIFFTAFALGSYHLKVLRSEMEILEILEFSRHFFQWVLLQVFITENIIIL